MEYLSCCIYQNLGMKVSSWRREKTGREKEELALQFNCLETFSEAGAKEEEESFNKQA